MGVYSELEILCNLQNSPARRRRPTLLSLGPLPSSSKGYKRKRTRKQVLDETVPQEYRVTWENILDKGKIQAPNLSTLETQFVQTCTARNEYVG